MLLLAGVTGVALMGSIMLLGGESPDDADAEPGPETPDDPDAAAAEDRAAGLMALLGESEGGGTAAAPTPAESDRGPEPGPADEDM
uniref:hypothetical protein n=1 Tax=Rhodosalinus sediminis TaxID=1940533 RepID=UPI002351FDBA